MLEIPDSASNLRSVEPFVLQANRRCGQLLNTRASAKNQIA